MLLPIGISQLIPIPHSVFKESKLANTCLVWPGLYVSYDMITLGAPGNNTKEEAPLTKADESLMFLDERKGIVIKGIT